MKKYFSAISVIIGIIVNINLFSTSSFLFIQSINFIILIPILGIILSIISLLNNRNKIVMANSILGICLNIFPIFYILFLYFTW